VRIFREEAATLKHVTLKLEGIMPNILFGDAEPISAIFIALCLSPPAVNPTFTESRCSSNYAPSLNR
jgi:hypothetical protein